MRHFTAPSWKCRKQPGTFGYTASIQLTNKTNTIAILLPFSEVSQHAEHWTVLLQIRSSNKTKHFKDFKAVIVECTEDLVVRNTVTIDTWCAVNFAKDGAPYLMLLSMYEVSCILSIRSKACFAFKFGAKNRFFWSGFRLQRCTPATGSRFTFVEMPENTPEAFLRENFISSSSQMRN